MSGQFVCLFCSSVFKSKSKGKRHSVTHLPWYFGNILCIIYEQRFEVKQNLFEHCKTNSHQRKLDANKAPFDVESEKVQRQFVEIERSRKTVKLLLVLQKKTLQKKSSSPTLTALSSTFAASMDEVAPQGGSSDAPLSQRSTDVDPSLLQLVQQMTDLQLRSANCRPIEGKLDSLNKKVVDTAESKTADLKNRLSKLEECVKHNTTQVQGYSEMLAMALQRDITKVLETVGQLGRFKGHKSHWRCCQH